MDSLKVFPQIFFDFIGRVIPGGFALLLSFVVFGTRKWEAIMNGLNLTEIDGSAIISFSIYLLFSYATGHLLSPVTKLVEAIGKSFPTPLKKPNSADYEWLRMYFPNVGGICAKLRAEFTMYNGLAAVLWIFFVVGILARALSLDVNELAKDGWNICGLALVAAAMMYRGRVARETFATSVSLFREAANNPPDHA